MGLIHTGLQGLPGLAYDMVSMDSFALVYSSFRGLVPRTETGEEGEVLAGPRAQDKGS